MPNPRSFWRAYRHWRYVGWDSRLICPIPMGRGNSSHGYRMLWAQPRYLVNNAAYSAETPIEELTAEMLDRHYEVNLRATALLSAEFVRCFTSGSGGRIINLTSGQGAFPMPSELAYAATKGGIDAFTLSLSEAVAKKGITVNAVDPGPTDTGWINGTLRSSLSADAPMGRIGNPLDAARLIAFLASEEAGWITGQIIRSRGGL